MSSRHTDTRQHILDTGNRIIAAKGFSCVGLAELLQASDVPKGSFYHYFKSSEAFGQALLQDYFDNYLGQLDTLFGTPGLDGRTQLLALFRPVAQHPGAGDRNEQKCLVVKLGAEVADLSEAMWLTLRDGTDRIIGRLADCVESGVADGSLPALEPCPRHARCTSSGSAPACWPSCTATKARSSMPGRPPSICSNPDFFARTLDDQSNFIPEAADTAAQGADMLNFDYYNPTRIVFGKDSIARLDELVPAGRPRAGAVRRRQRRTQRHPGRGRGRARRTYRAALRRHRTQPGLRDPDGRGRADPPREARLPARRRRRLRHRRHQVRRRSGRTTSANRGPSSRPVASTSPRPCRWAVC